MEVSRLYAKGINADNGAGQCLSCLRRRDQAFLLHVLVTAARDEIAGPIEVGVVFLVHESIKRPLQVAPHWRTRPTLKLAVSCSIFTTLIKQDCAVLTDLQRWVQNLEKAAEVLKKMSRVLRPS